MLHTWLGVGCIPWICLSWQGIYTWPPWFVQLDQESWKHMRISQHSGVGLRRLALAGGLL